MPLERDMAELAMAAFFEREPNMIPDPLSAEGVIGRGMDMRPMAPVLALNADDQARGEVMLTKETDHA